MIFQNVEVESFDQNGSYLFLGQNTVLVKIQHIVFYCRAFPSNKSDITFISEGFRQWSKACFKSFPKHEQSVSHKESSTKIAGYNEAKQSGSIINKVNTQYNQEVAENREYLKCVLETLLFCARQGIAIRGHRENEESQNKGNFQELLNLRSIQR